MPISLRCTLWKITLALLLILVGVLSVCAPALSAGSAAVDALAGADALTEVDAIVVGGEPKQILSHPSLPLLYVSDSRGQVVDEVDLTTGLVARRFPVPGSPVGLALSDDGHRLYVALYSGGKVVALDTGDGGVEAQSGHLDHPWEVDLVTGPSGRRLLAVTQHYSDVVSFLDPAALCTETSLSTGYWPYGMAVDDASRRLYVVSYGAYLGGEVQSIDLDHLTQVWRRHAGSGSFGICVDASRSAVFVSDNVGETVSRFTTSGDRSDPYRLPGRPMGVVSGEGGEWLAAAVRTRDLVYAVDAGTGRTVFTAEVGHLPVALEWVQGGYGEWPQALAVGNEGDGTVSILAPAPPLEVFTDVPSDHIFARDIRILALRGAVSGYPQAAGTAFLPEGMLNRAQMAKILVTSLALHTEQVEPAVVQYWDVPADAAAFPFDAVQEATAAGIVRGLETGPPRFGPWEHVTRLQLVRMVVRAAQAMGCPLPEAEGQSPFADMRVGDADYAAVMSAYQAGLISGAPGVDGLLYLNPAEPVTRGQTAKIVCRLLGVLGEVSGL